MNHHIERVSTRRKKMTNILEATPFGATSTTDAVLSGINLKGKRILVTGVSAGLGVETARSMAAHGSQVVGAARDLKKATVATEQVRKDAAANGGSFELVEIDLTDPNFERTPYEPFIAYGRSKTANILFALAFDRRHRDRGVRAAAVHPGGIRTELGRYAEPGRIEKVIDEINRQLAEQGKGPFQWKTIPQGAATSVWAAVVAQADQIGGQYCENCHVAEIVPDDTPITAVIEGVRRYALD